MSGLEYLAITVVGSGVGVGYMLFFMEVIPALKVRKVRRGYPPKHALRRGRTQAARQGPCEALARRARVSTYPAARWRLWRAVRRLR
jgi:hypothetical protein